jgi:hypothetical protein
MHILAKGHMGTNLIPKIQAKNYQLLQTRFAINLISVLSVSVAALFAISSLWNAVEIKHKTEDMASQTNMQETLYQAVSSNFIKTPVPGSQLKIAAELAQKFDSLKQNPQRLMVIISQALDTQSEIQIKRLRWTQTDDANIKDSEGPKDNTPTTVHIPPPPRPASGLYEIGFMDGEIKNFSGDYRAAQASVEALTETLRKNNQVAQVTIVRQPVNTSSLVSLQGSTLDNNTQQVEPARFSLKLILKSEVEPMAKSNGIVTKS